MQNVILNDFVEIYLNNSNIDCVKVPASNVGYIRFEDGFIRIFDVEKRIYHCYNIENITHYHYPAGIPTNRKKV